MLPACLHLPSGQPCDIIVTGTRSTAYVHEVTIVTAATSKWIFPSQQRLMLNDQGCEQLCQLLGLLVSLLMRPILLPPPREGEPYSPHLGVSWWEPGAPDGGAEDHICTQIPVGLDLQPSHSGASRVPPGSVGARVVGTQVQEPPYLVPAHFHPIRPTPTILPGNWESYVRPSGWTGRPGVLQSMGL